MNTQTDKYHFVRCMNTSVTVCALNGDVWNGICVYMCMQVLGVWGMGWCVCKCVWHVWLYVVCICVYVVYAFMHVCCKMCILGVGMACVCAGVGCVRCGV